MLNSISRPTRRTLVGFAAAATLTAGFGIAENAHAAPVTLTSTVASSGYSGGTLAAMPLTADNSFVKQNTPWTYDADAVDAKRMRKKS